MIRIVMVDYVIPCFDSIESVKGLVVVVKPALETMDCLVVTFVNDAGLHPELLVADQNHVGYN